MKCSATSFLHFLLVTCPIILEIRLVQSIRQRQSVQIVTTKKKSLDRNINVDVQAKRSVHHRRHGLMPSNTNVRRRIESGEMIWEPLGQMIVGTQWDQSGFSIAMSDDGRIIAIGAPYNDDGGSSAGHARVFRLTNTSQSWTQIGSDIDGKEGEHMGDSLDISVDGTRLVIGGPWASDISGVVRIYENLHDEWVQVGAELRGKNLYDRFGWSVAMSSDGTVIAVGAYLNDDNGYDSGSVSVYSEKAGSWELAGSKIYGDGENDWFGLSVSLSGDALVLAIGAPGRSNDGAGYAKLYNYEIITDGERDWVKYAKLNGHYSGDRFGREVSLSNDASHLALSAYNNEMVKVYKVSKDKNEVGNGIYVQDEYAAISFSNDGRSLIVGDGYNDIFGNDAGRAQVFRFNGEVWEQVGGDLYSLDDPDTFATKAKDHRFGFSGAISGDGSTVAAGAIFSSLEGKVHSGHVRVFKMRQQPSQSPTPRPTPLPTRSQSPTQSPTLSPTPSPTQPSDLGLVKPSQSPTPLPIRSQSPTHSPTPLPTPSPTQPSDLGLIKPSQLPTPLPTRSQSPTHSPTLPPTRSPTLPPTQSPTLPPTQPSDLGLVKPSQSPTSLPTRSQSPTTLPTRSKSPTTPPTRSKSPTTLPTLSPTPSPKGPSDLELVKPSQSPTPLSTRSQSPTQSFNLGLVIGLCAGAGIFFLVAGLMIICLKNKNKKEDTEKNAAEELNQPPQVKTNQPANTKNNTAAGTKDSSKIIHQSQNHYQQQQQQHVFFSARFLGDETERQARQLHQEIQNLGVKTFMVEAGVGQKFGQDVNSGLTNMAVLLAICSSNYGERTQSSYSTFCELKHAFEHHIPIFPIKLCDVWPPHPPKDFDGGDRGWEQNNIVFTKDLIYCDWSKKNWDATECAKEVKAALEKMGKCPLAADGSRKSGKLNLPVYV